jgi:hypothetical protein
MPTPPEGSVDAVGWQLLCRGVSYDPAELRRFAAGV